MNCFRSKHAALLFRHWRCLSGDWWQIDGWCYLPSVAMSDASSRKAGCCCKPTTKSCMSRGLPMPNQTGERVHEGIKKATITAQKKKKEEKKKRL